MASKHIDLSEFAVGITLFDPETLQPAVGSYQNVRIADDLYPTLRDPKRPICGVHVQADIWSVLHKLLRARPYWTFEFVDADYLRQLPTGYPICLVGFTAYHNGEELGTINISYNRRRHAIGVRNARIAKKRHRGSTAFTSDPTVAARFALGMFMPLELHEAVSKSVDLGNQLLSAAHYKQRDTHTQAEGAFFAAATAFVNRHEAQYIEEFSLQDQQAARIAARAEVRAIELAMNILKSERGVLVLLQPDGRCRLVYSPATASAERRVEPPVPQTDLPPDVASRLGILKLVDTGGIVPLAGVRLDDDLFLTYTGESLASVADGA